MRGPRRPTGPSPRRSSNRSSRTKLSCWRSRSTPTCRTPSSPPAFPVGSVIYDQKDRKHFEVTHDGTEQVYQPKAKGLQGTVFVYHLLWIASAAAYLFIRKGTI